MARISSISIKQEPEHYILTIRKTINFMNEYSDFAEQSLAKTNEYINILSLFPAGGPIVYFHNTDLEKLDVEIGWQITQHVKNKNDMLCQLVPSRKVVTAIDLGPYEEQDPTLIDIFEWIKINALEPKGPICYYYLNDTKRPASEYLTQMLLPIQ